MAMNNPGQVPEQSMAAAPVEESAVAPEAVAAQPEAVAPVEQGAATPEQEAQVVEGIAQAVEEEQISARDIMTAILSDSLGISPAGANSLFELLMQDLVDETPTEELVEPEVPPTEGV